MKRKKVFKLFAVGCILLVLLLSTSCGFRECAGKPEMKWTTLPSGEKAMVYKGSTYIRNRDIVEDYLYGDYFVNFEERTVVAAVTTIFARYAIYISTMDTENMILQNRVVGGIFYYVKEGFELPDIENTKINRIFLQEGCYDAMSEARRKYIDSYGGGLMLHEIVEANERVLEEPPYVGTCFLELEGYAYLKVGQISVREAEGELYLCIGEDRHGVENRHDAYKCYKLKDEYQESFRNAINELNNT